MKTIIAFFFAAFFAGTSIAQDQTQNQLGQPPPQGWYQQISGTTGGLGGVYFLTRDSGWVADYPGALYTTNGGNNWQTYLPEVEVIAFIGSFGYGYSPKGDGWISVTTNRGQSWNDYNTEFDGAGLYYFCTPLRGFCHAIVNSRDRIARTEDGGKTWIADTKDTVGQIASFVCFDSLHAIAGGSGYPNPEGNGTFISGIFYTSDGGASWKFTMKNPIVNAGFGPFVAFDTSTVYFLGGPAPHAYYSHNRGYTLASFSLPIDAFPNPDVPQGAYASDPNNITIVGTSGKIYRSYDGGLNWVRQNSGTLNILYAVTFIDSTTGWAVGDAGTILHTTNAGYSWVKQQITQPLEVKVNPEPFATKTTISYSIPNAAKVNITVYDVTGREVYHLESPEIQNAGAHSIEMPADGLSAGVYTFLLVAGSFTGMGKMTKIVP